MMVKEDIKSSFLSARHTSVTVELKMLRLRKARLANNHHGIILLLPFCGLSMPSIISFLLSPHVTAHVDADLQPCKYVPFSPSC
ncbi:hypothetical protein BR93DRAFT_291404 [Coniochaeta sp. PMI_546]|nr:hypothetical protein BR93DRAFT_291404 [Coniochaeta sp. PMI_546]